jgi:hypothetical protein
MKPVYKYKKREVLIVLVSRRLSNKINIREDMFPFKTITYYIIRLRILGISLK